MLHQGSLDLTKLDTEATQLDLEVGATKYLEFAVSQEAGEVAGTIDAAAVDERVVEELLGIQFITLPVTAGDTVATDEQFSGNPIGAGFICSSST